MSVFLKIILNIITISIQLLLIVFFTFSIPISANPIVKTGIDVLQETNFAEISSKKVILFTNSTGRNQQGELTAQILSKQSNIELISIITPEHGFFASAPAGEKVPNDQLFGVKIYSLYGDIRKPGNKILNAGDIILVDIQDIGVRSYTYISTLFRIMQAAAENNKPIYILDRPNPLGGNNVDGNVLEKGMESFVGIIPTAYIHGMTIAEIAFMINEEGWLNDGIAKNLKCNLNIIKMNGYERNMVWEDTGLMWYPTSPNVPTVNSARGLAMIGIFGELGIISIGIGTATPFQLVGSPDFDWGKVSINLKFDNFSGIKMSETRYLPQFGMYGQKAVKGIFLNFNKSDNFTPYTAGINLFLAIRAANPELFYINNVKENSKSMFQKVTGTSNLFNALFNNIQDENVMKISQIGLDVFKEFRKKYLIYE
jgi:uncharacterized protein YbbC (DUF1343 family)